MRRAAEASAGLAHADALIAAEAAAAHARENVMALAVLLLVAGAASGGAAGLLAVAGRREGVWWAAAGGVTGVAAAVLVFVNRPAGVSLPTLAAARPGAAAAPAGRLACAFDPARSRVTVSSTPDTTLAWSGKGCAGGHRWTETPTGWEQVAVGADGAVSVRRYDPTARRLDDTRWLLPPGDVAALDKLAGAYDCAADPAAVASAQAAIRARLPGLPNEKLSYLCAPVR